MKGKYHVLELGSKGAEETIQKFCQTNGQMLLPVVDLITEARLAVDEVIDRAGRGLIENSEHERRANRGAKESREGERRGALAWPAIGEGETGRSPAAGGAAPAAPEGRRGRSAGLAEKREDGRGDVRGTVERGFDAAVTGVSKSQVGRTVGAALGGGPGDLPGRNAGFISAVGVDSEGCAGDSTGRDRKRRCGERPSHPPAPARFDQRYLFVSKRSAPRKYSAAIKRCPSCATWLSGYQRATKCWRTGAVADAPAWDCRGGIVRIRWDDRVRSSGSSRQLARRVGGDLYDQSSRRSSQPPPLPGNHEPHREPAVGRAEKDWQCLPLARRRDDVALGGRSVSADREEFPEDHVINLWALASILGRSPNAASSHKEEVA